MVDYCANPNCLKPLHYLREGAIYIFETTENPADGSARSLHQHEHYWLCGDCSLGHRLERAANRELHLVARREQRFVRRPGRTAATLIAAKTA